MLTHLFQTSANEFNNDRNILQDRNKPGRKIIRLFLVLSFGKLNNHRSDIRLFGIQSFVRFFAGRYQSKSKLL